MEKNNPYQKMIPKKTIAGLSILVCLMLYPVIRGFGQEILRNAYSRSFSFYNSLIFTTSNVVVILRHLFIMACVTYAIYTIICFLFVKCLENRDVEYWQQLVNISREELGYWQTTKQERIEMQEDFEKLSSYMAHEQKNILSVLRGKVQLKEDIELLDEVDRAVVGIDDVLTMSASQSMMENQRVDMTLLCADVVDEYRKLYSEITYDFPEDKSCIVQGKELWLERAVSNLLENAIKYGEQTPIHVQLQSNKRSIIITVEDEGQSLQKSNQDKIFELYYRTEGIKTDGYGIGLGLVKHVCSLCKGVFWVEKTKKNGSRFYIVLPTAKEVNKS